MGRVILALAFLAVASPLFAQPDDGVHLRILRNYRLAEGAISREPIVVIGGTATIDGRVEHDVTVIGGTLRVGPKAVITGDVVTVGGDADIDPAAQIGGDVERSTVILPDVGVELGRIVNGWWPYFRFGAVVMRLGIIFVVALLLTAIAPRVIADIGQHAVGSPATSGLYGVAGQVLFVPATVAIAIALAISIVGIPLLLAFPFLFGAAALLWVAGYAAVAATLGARLRGNTAGASDTPVVDLLIGLLIISSVTLLAHALTIGSGVLVPFSWSLRVVGWVIEWMAWTVGLGAALAWLFGRRQPVTPPPVPWPSPAPTVP